MATIFPKPDPNNPSVKRWMGKIKVGSDWKSVSLRLLANGNKREAQARANDLEIEMKAGMISESSRVWLGEATFLRLSIIAGRNGTKIADGSPDTWRSSLDAYLQSTHARDTKSSIEGKVKVEHKTRSNRKHKLMVFVKWAEENSVQFNKESITNTIKRYLEYRRGIGIKSNTLWNNDYTLICCWGDWLAKRSLCDIPNRQVIREVLADKDSPVIKVPSWQEDLKSIRFFHSKRLTSSTGPDWKRLASYWSAWSLVLVVRGLGCRPSEATALSWETVDFKSETVRFIRSKNKKTRRVPILFDWVKEGLKEAWERDGCPRTGAVCKTAEKKIWTFDASSANLMLRLGRLNDLPVYHLKAAQKLFIAHAIQLGFPPHVVAHWTDHSLTIQERHYHEGDGYLPPEDGWDYAEFGRLSEYGLKVKKHTSFLANDMPIL